MQHSPMTPVSWEAALSPVVDALMAEIMGCQWRAFATLFPRAAVCVGTLRNDIWLRERVGGEIKAMLSRYPEEGISFPNLNEFIQEMFIEHLQCAKSWENHKQMQKLKIAKEIEPSWSTQPIAKGWGPVVSLSVRFHICRMSTVLCICTHLTQTRAWWASIPSAVVSVLVFLWGKFFMLGSSIFIFMN